METIKFYQEKIEQLENKVLGDIQEEIKKICKKHNLVFFSGMGTWVFTDKKTDINYGLYEFERVEKDYKDGTPKLKAIWKDFEKIYKYSSKIDSVLRMDNCLSQLTDVK